MDPLEFIVFVVLGLGSLTVFMVILVIIPFWNYLTTGKVWNFNRYGRSHIVFKGKNALRIIFVSAILFNRFAWEGASVVFVSSLLMVFATLGAKRVPRNKIF